MTRRLADVARKVGVSEATVSRVLNGKPGVSDSTRETVLTALDVLGYERPTKLHGDRARLVGLVLPELQNPIFPAFAEVISGGLTQNGYTPVLCTQTASGISEADYLELLLQQRVSGVIFVGGAYSQENARHEHYARLADLQLPTVMVNARVESLEFATISCDDWLSIEYAFAHLTQLGHTRIGVLLGPPDHIPSRRKLAAARAAAAQYSLELGSDMIANAFYSLEAGQSAAAKLFSAGATAIVSASDPMALGAVRAASRMGIDVPTGASVIGFDDSALMNCTAPPLTTIRQPIEAMGKVIIESLMRQISGDAMPHDELLFTPELVVRGSTAPPPQPLD